VGVAGLGGRYMKVTSGRMKLNVFCVNNVTSSCWPHKFVDLMLNPVLGSG
jgi:hypothetical protein